MHAMSSPAALLTSSICSCVMQLSGFTLGSTMSMRRLLHAEKLSLKQVNEVSLESVKLESVEGSHRIFLVWQHAALRHEGHRQPKHLLDEGHGRLAAGSHQRHRSECWTASLAPHTA